MQRAACSVQRCAERVDSSISSVRQVSCPDAVSMRGQSGTAHLKAVLDEPQSWFAMLRVMLFYRCLEDNVGANGLVQTDEP